MEHKYAYSYQAGNQVMVFLSTYTVEEKPFFFFFWGWRFGLMFKEYSSLFLTDPLRSFVKRNKKIELLDKVEAGEAGK